MTTDEHAVHRAEFARAEKILVEAIGQLHFLQRFGVVSPEQMDLIDKARREIGRVVLAAGDYEYTQRGCTYPHCGHDFPNQCKQPD